MSLCKQAGAPARGRRTSFGRPWLRVPLNGCRKTKPFQSVPWKRQTTVPGLDREGELAPIWQTVSCDLSSAVGRRRNTPRICVVCKSGGRTTSRLLWWKLKNACAKCFRLRPALFRPVLAAFSFLFSRNNTRLSRLPSCNGQGPLNGVKLKKFECLKKLWF